MPKPWDRVGNYRRKQETRSLRERILIVCEGEKTEPNYFRAFPVHPEVVQVDVAGTGANTLSLVIRAVELMAKARSEGWQYNRVWCVFDKDSFSDEQFNSACRMAEKHRIKAAYSNECFELWYFLHFHYTDTPLHRDAFSAKLAEAMKRPYKKNDTGMYTLLRKKQGAAIRNAKKLLAIHDGNSPAKSNPSTTVFELVEVLNEFVDGGK